MNTSYYSSHSRFLIAVDCIILGFKNKELYLLLTRRQVEPMKNEWSLMGGFMDEQESLKEAAAKTLTSLHTKKYLYGTSGAYGELNRDSGDRVVSVAFLDW